MSSAIQWMAATEKFIQWYVLESFFCMKLWAVGTLGNAALSMKLLQCLQEPRGLRGAAALGWVTQVLVQGLCSPPAAAGSLSI